jgi:hypothetical protein
LIEYKHQTGWGDLMAGCSQPVGNMGMSQGADIACNGDKDTSAAAYCQDKDVSASSAIENASYCNNSQSHNAEYYVGIILEFCYHESQGVRHGYGILPKWELLLHEELKLHIHISRFKIALNNQLC